MILATVNYAGLAICAGAAFVSWLYVINTPRKH